MTDIQYFTVIKSVTSVTHIVVGAQHHDIAMRSPRIDNILCLANIVSGVIKPSDVMVIESIILDDE